MAVFTIYGGMLLGILTDALAIPNSIAELADWFVATAVPTAIYIALYRYSIQEQSLLNERYQRAVEKFLGENQLTRKAGQIELQNLAKKYRAELHSTIMLQFCEFVRHSSSAYSDTTTDERIAEGLFDEVQAVMQTMCSRSKATLRYEKRRRLCWNLRSSNLAEFDLSNLSLANLDLTDANFAKTDLSNACIMDTVQGLTIEQIKQAVWASDSPPRIEGAVDAVTGQELVWPI
ncbi:MAG: pentapeptide repeat-containing protein [Candidatus Poribacteria bacterium]|nr:pentapeptide repeat-containing protein [Candidatus Poribacteria bacterium]